MTSFEKRKNYIGFLTIGFWGIVFFSTIGISIAGFMFCVLCRFGQGAFMDDFEVNYNRPPSRRNIILAVAAAPLWLLVRHQILGEKVKSKAQ